MDCLKFIDKVNNLLYRFTFEFCWYHLTESCMNSYLKDLYNITPLNIYQKGKEAKSEPNYLFLFKLNYLIA